MSEEKLATESAWESVADDILAVIEKRLEKTIRKTADTIYEDVHDSILDNLASNVKFNMASRLATAESQARKDRKHADDAERKFQSLWSAFSLVQRVARNDHGAELGLTREQYELYGKFMEAAGFSK